MFNLYSIIVGLFTLAGAIVAIWSWKNIQQKRQTVSWSSVEGVIVDVQKSAKENNLLPLVKFNYQVNNVEFHGIVDVPSGESAMPDFAEKFTSKYPLNSSITVYYNPDKPEMYQLQSGVNREDWLIFSVGIGAFLLGFIFLAANL